MFDRVLDTTVEYFVNQMSLRTCEGEQLTIIKVRAEVI